jgi:hypothetical protein
VQPRTGSTLLRAIPDMLHRKFSPTGIGSYAIWHLGSAAFALAYNIGSFVVEYAVIVAHVRLLADLKDRADRLREERYGLAGARGGGVDEQPPATQRDSPIALP